jgi:hypothetical protein
MNIDKLLTVAGLAGAEKQRAIDCLLEAHKRADGLLLRKLKARWLMAGYDLKAPVTWSVLPTFK